MTMRKLINLMESVDPLEASFDLRKDTKVESTAIAVHSIAEEPINAVDSAIPAIAGDYEFLENQYNGYKSGYLHFMYRWSFKMWLEEFNFPIKGYILLECYMDPDTSLDPSDIATSSKNKIYFTVFSDATKGMHHVKPTYSGLMYALQLISEDVDAQNTAQKVMHALSAASKLNSQSSNNFRDQGHASASSTIQTTTSVDVYDISDILSGVSKEDFNTGLQLYKTDKRLSDNQVHIDPKNGTMTVAKKSSFTWD